MLLCKKYYDLVKAMLKYQEKINDLELEKRLSIKRPNVTYPEWFLGNCSMIFGKWQLRSISRYSHSELWMKMKFNLFLIILT